MKQILVFSTHIEITPYRKGESKELENLCSSTWNPVTHRRNPIGWWIPDGSDTLIIPRGISLLYLQNLYRSEPVFMDSWKAASMRYDYKVKWEPKNKDQMNAILFLLSKNKFAKGVRYSQLSLTAAPGFGKTYSSLVAALENRKRTLIICHKADIRDQWKSTLEKMSDIPKEQILILDNSNAMVAMENSIISQDFIICLHATLSSYERLYGANRLALWLRNLECGLKIIDEVHLNFEHTVHIDMLCNIPRNYYLSATMSRSDRSEVRLFQNVFAASMKYGDDIEMEKNVEYTFIHYNSCPSEIEQGMIKTSFGVSRAKFGDYAFNMDENKTIVQVLLVIFEKIQNIPGRILITAPKIENCEMIKEMFENNYYDYDIRTVHSKHSKEENEDAKQNAEIIVSTIASLGVGSDIAKLRILINMEPFSSALTAKQLVGRLRLYGAGQISYAYDFVDVGFDSLIEMEKKRMRSLKPVVKKLLTKHFEDL